MGENEGGLEKERKEGEIWREGCRSGERKEEEEEEREREERKDEPTFTPREGESERACDKAQSFFCVGEKVR